MSSPKIRFPIKVLVIDNDIVKKGSYRGFNGEKLTWVNSINKQIYMIKSKERNDKSIKNLDNKTITSYNNSILSEYVGSNIINVLGYDNVKAQQTFIVEYNNEQWVACKHLTKNINGYKEIDMVDFDTLSGLYKITKTSHGSEIQFRSKTIDFEFVDKWIDEQEYVDKNILSNWFYDVFMIDAFLLNWDRNPTNFGLLIYTDNDNIDTYTLSPLYDQGSTLLSKYDRESLELLTNLTHKDHIYGLVTKTRSYFSDALNGFDEKLNYHYYLKNTPKIEVLKAMHRFINKVKINEVINLINKLNLPDDFKATYKFLISESYKQIKKSILANKNYKSFLD